MIWGAEIGGKPFPDFFVCPMVAYGRLAHLKEEAY